MTGLVNTKPMTDLVKSLTSTSENDMKCFVSKELLTLLPKQTTNVFSKVRPLVDLLQMTGWKWSVTSLLIARNLELYNTSVCIDVFFSSI